jgi:hypothetical protein
MRKSPLFLTVVLVLVASLGLGCQSQLQRTTNGQSSVSDDQTFETIWKYYQETFPSITFQEGEFVHTVDGPLARQRVHVAVPQAVDAEYQHRFSEAFLSSQLRNPDGLTRYVAGDLLLMRHRRLFCYASRHGYDGTTVNCTTYVVEAIE